MSDNGQEKFTVNRSIYHMVNGHPVQDIVTVELEGFPKEANSAGIIEDINRRNVLALEKAIANQYPDEKILVVSDYNHDKVNTTALRGDKLLCSKNSSEGEFLLEEMAKPSINDVYNRDIHEMKEQPGDYGKYLSPSTVYYNYLYMLGLTVYGEENGITKRSAERLLDYDGFVDLYATTPDAPSPAEGLNLFASLSKDGFFDTLSLPKKEEIEDGRRFYAEKALLDTYYKKVVEDYYVPNFTNRIRQAIIESYERYERGEITEEKLNENIKKHKNHYVKVLSSLDLDIEIDPDSLQFFGGNPLTGERPGYESGPEAEYPEEYDMPEYDYDAYGEWEEEPVGQYTAVEEEQYMEPTGQSYYSDDMPVVPQERVTASPLNIQAADGQVIPEKIARALREISEMNVSTEQLNGMTPANWSAETLYGSRCSYNEVFTEAKLRALAVRLRVNEAIPFEAQVEAAHEIFARDREVRELLYRAGNFDEAEKKLEAAGAGIGAKAFMELGRRGLEQIPSPHQMAAIHNLEKGETRAIIAVPGSGKTSSLIFIMENAIAKGTVKPNEITAISYTTSAAGELNDRINSRNADLVGSGIKISTAHALARSIIRLYAPNEPLRILPENSIEKEGFYTTLVAQTFEELQKIDNMNGVPYNVEKYNLLQRQMGDKNQSLERALNIVRLAPWSEKQFEKASVQYSIPLDALKKAYEVSVKLKAARGYIDFEDMLLKAVNILATNPQARAEVQSRAKLLIVDEYQDTSPLQYLFESMIRPADGIKVVVGDDDQAIFSVLGADKNLLKNYATGKLAEKMRRVLVESGYIENIECPGYQKTGYYVIPKNYRSDREITVIGNSQGRFIPERIPKKIEPSEWAQNGGLPQWHNVNDKEAEFRFACETIRYGLQSGRRGEDYAVLFRWGKEKREFDAYIAQNYPDIRSALAVIGTSPYVSDFINNKDADSEFKPILESLSKPDNGYLFNTLLSYCGNLSSLYVNEQSSTPLAEFEKLAREKGMHTADVAAFTQAYKEAVKETTADEAICTFVNTRSKILTGKKYSFEGYHLKYLDVLMDKGISREGGFEFHALMEEEAARPDNNSVVVQPGINVMTYHKSKGREFNTVFLMGLEDKNIDKQADKLEKGDVQKDQYAETERLIYVGMTRAKHECYMLSCAYSKFLNHLSPESIRYFENWEEKSRTNKAVRMEYRGRIIPPVCHDGNNKTGKQKADIKSEQTAKEKAKPSIQIADSLIAETVDDFGLGL